MAKRGDEAVVEDQLVAGLAGLTLPPPEDPRVNIINQVMCTCIHISRLRMCLIGLSAQVGEGKESLLTLFPKMQLAGIKWVYPGQGLTTTC